MKQAWHKNDIIYEGTPVEKATGAIILLHGRGAGAVDILGLANYLHTEGMALLALQATHHTWYPQSFLAPPVQNEPALSSAISLVHATIDNLVTAGIPSEKIFLAGFSQGACLALESAARKAQRYGGIIAFTGGLIGDKIYRDNYKGDFADTPIYIGTSDVDPHVPVNRVYASANILREMGGKVEEQIFSGMGHTINEDELNAANRILDTISTNTL